jgi:hypothetical protein
VRFGRSGFESGELRQARVALHASQEPELTNVEKHGAKDHVADHAA